MPDTSPSELLARKLATLQKWWLALGFFMAVVIVFLLGLGLYGLRERAQAREDGRRFFCQQIELLKKGERDAAWQSWRDLDKNLRLLGIEKTPEIVDAARKSRDMKLRQYAAIDCDRVAGGYNPSA